MPFANVEEALVLVALMVGRLMPVYIVDVATPPAPAVPGVWTKFAVP